MILKVLSRLGHSGVCLAIAALSATPVLAEASNFGTLTLNSGFPPPAGIAIGYTSGSFSLSSIANRDRNNNLCLGYAGDRDVPDHVLVLQSNFAQLRLQVNSKGGRTTLLVKGPNNTIRCGDASLEDVNWQAGTYQVWVGASDSGAKQDYTLSVQE